MKSCWVPKLPDFTIKFLGRWISLSLGYNTKYILEVIAWPTIVST